MQSLNRGFNTDYSINIMEVRFTKTAERRYRVSVEGPDVVSSYMDPAPGYDARLPHDMAHFMPWRTNSALKAECSDNSLPAVRIHPDRPHQAT